MRRRLGGPIGAVLGAGSAFCLAVVAYYEVLGYWFTGTDTIPLIETSRVATLGGALEIFAEPLMEGSHFTDRALFYRPVASLSYAIDYWLWGLDPFGYHLTDLLAHATAAALVCWLVYEVVDDALTAAIAGWVFAIHPLSVEVVPTPARRHDVLATLFALVALALFVRATKGTLATKSGASTTADTEPKGEPTASASESVGTIVSSDEQVRSWRRRWLLVAGSVLAYLLALGSKEIAVIVPALVGTWFLVSAYGERPPLQRLAKSGAVLLGPYAVATAAYLILRLVVLGGLGGYDRPTAEVSTEAIAVTTSRYVLSLVYPVDFVGALSRFEFQLIPNGLYVVIAGASILAVHNVSRTHGDRSVLASARGRLLALSGIWFTVPVWLFVRTGRYTLRSGYVSIVPVAVTLGVVLVAASREVVTRRRKRADEADEPGVGGGELGRGRGHRTNGRYGAGRERGGRGGPGVATLVVACVLLVSLVAGSALVQPYDEWEHAGETSEETLGAITGATEGIAANATLDVSPVPHPESARRMSSFPHAQSVTFVWGNTIESWLRLQGRSGTGDIYINDTVVLNDAPRETTARARNCGDRVAVTIRYDDRGNPAGDRTHTESADRGATGSDYSDGSENPDDDPFGPACERSRSASKSGVPA